MHDFWPVHIAAKRSADIRPRIAASENAPTRHPSPAELFFEIGVTLSATLGIAVVSNILILALMH